MNAYEIIYKKREGKVLSREELGWMVNGFIAGLIPDYQMSAFLMAVFFNGMNKDEVAELTRVMLESGEKMDLSGLGPTVDKHSTGGVGDGLSVVIAPLASSLGIVVPMMSGRCLGHTGGTLDKLESIPGFDVNFTRERFIAQLKEIGVAIIGQTENIVPADKILYALRDVTATVDSIPLISASIMSKKLAGGADALVLDVKTGSGAFMKSREDARKLAFSLIETGLAYGRKITALITDMSCPLGCAVGNALEIEQAVKLMSGEGPSDIENLVIETVAEMLIASGLSESIPDARRKASENLSNGRALEKFAGMVSMQGGDGRVAEKPERYLPQPGCFFEVKAPEGCFISSMDTRRIGICALETGAGRKRLEDRIDFSAGIRVLKKTGDRIEKGEPVAVLQSTGVRDLKRIADDYISALEFSDKASYPELIYEVIR